MSAIPARITARLLDDAILAEGLRRAVVCACALVLICAGRALPL